MGWGDKKNKDTASTVEAPTGMEYPGDYIDSVVPRYARPGASMAGQRVVQPAPNVIDRGGYDHGVSNPMSDHDKDDAGFYLTEDVDDNVSMELPEEDKADEMCPVPVRIVAEENRQRIVTRVYQVPVGTSGVMILPEDRRREKAIIAMDLTAPASPVFLVEQQGSLAASGFPVQQTVTGGCTPPLVFEGGEAMFAVTATGSGTVYVITQSREKLDPYDKE